jgi:hypothetical protein
VRRYGETIGAFEAGRGCPFQCSFCTIINVQGRKSRWRDADDVERRVERDPNPYSDPALMTINNKSTLPSCEKIAIAAATVRPRRRQNTPFKNPSRGRGARRFNSELRRPFTICGHIHG